MQKTIRPGTVFIKERTLLPEAVRLETESYVTGWTQVKNLDGYGLSRGILEAGWTFFCLAGEFSVTRFGFDAQNTEQRAVWRLLANAKSKKFNSLEIARTVSNRFLGLLYTTVYARSRHIQTSMFLFRDDDPQPWEHGKISSGMKLGAGSAKLKKLPLEETIRQPDLPAVVNL